MKSNDTESLKAFGLFMNEVSNPGALDAKTKELITISLVIIEKCLPCLDSHYDKAKGMGITIEEIDEAAWCAIAIGGACVRMFYAQWRKTHN